MEGEYPPPGNAETTVKRHKRRVVRIIVGAEVVRWEVEGGLYWAPY